jgi:hypothetical protein
MCGYKVLQPSFLQIAVYFTLTSFCKTGFAFED